MVSMNKLMERFETMMAGGFPVVCPPPATTPSPTALLPEKFRKQVKAPHFTGHPSEDAADFLLEMENYLDIIQAKKPSWGIGLERSLQGPALRWVQKISPSDRADYDTLKKLLLEEY